MSDDYPDFQQPKDWEPTDELVGGLQKRIENLEAALAVETRANVAMNHRMETLIDARNATIARANRYEAALRAIAHHPTGGVGCNPEQFVEAAKAALGGA